MAGGLISGGSLKGLADRVSKATDKARQDALGKGTAGGTSGFNGSSPNKNKPGEDNIAATQATTQTAKPLSDVEKAAIEAKRQRALLDPYMKGAETLLGLMPAPGMGMGLTLGNMMGSATEDDAIAHPDKYHTNLKDPGSLFSNRGPVSTNRAVTGPAAKSTEASTDENLKKKKQLPTLLGAPAQALGTFSNPVQIT